MTNGVKIERQGDGSYEVILDNGRRTTCRDFAAAVAFAEKELYPTVEEQAGSSSDSADCVT